MKAHHILNAASNLLGVSLIIVTFVHVTGRAAYSLTDELAFGAALLFMGSCLLSHRAISTENEAFETAADRVFLVAQLLLLGAVTIFWF